MLRNPIQIPVPLSTFPGANPQESGGRLINCYAEQLGEAGRKTAAAEVVWRGSSGLSQFALTGQVGYRGGLIVNNLSYEVFKNEVVTVDVTSAVVALGAFPGTKKVSIARDQSAPNPNIVAVDVDNGAYQLSGGGPVAYNGGGNLPQPNSVANQDGYFFFTIADGRCFASGLNALTQNALTFITVQSKSDVTLLRGIAFNGVLWLFTTGGYEIWQDTATPAPAFPYSRLLVGDIGLLQQAAIAGFETGFSELLWVAQDHGVYWVTSQSLAPNKVSSPDLERLIAQSARNGDILEAGCYEAGGKKFWHISSPTWSWEFNLNTKRWNERWSLQPTGIQGRWRATGGHKAFDKWLCGDELSGALLYHDETNFTENGRPQLFRIESGPARDFPKWARIVRADFDFDMGVGTELGNFVMTVLGTQSGTGGNVRLTVDRTSQAQTGDNAQIVGVGGTVEANGTFPMTVVDANHIEIPVQFQNAFTSGGVVTDITASPNAVNPVVAISMSNDGGRTYDNPSLRSLAPQGKEQRSRASVKNRGQAGALGVRWRLDITDPVYRAFKGGVMSDSPREARL